MFRNQVLRIAVSTVVSILGLALLAAPRISQAEGLPAGVRELVLAGKWEKAFEEFKDQKLDQADGVCRLVAAHACLATNRNNRALFLIMSPQPGHLRQWSDWTNKLVATDPHSAIACYLRADSLARTGDLEQAQLWFTRAIQADPKLSLAWVGRGILRAMAAQSEEDLNRAVLDFHEAKQAEPTLAEAHASLGTYWILRRNATGALDAFNDALSHNPNFALAYNGRGCALYGKGQPDQAARDFRRAEELFPALTVTAKMNYVFVAGMVARKVKQNLGDDHKVGTSLEASSQLLVSDFLESRLDSEAFVQRANEMPDLSAIGAALYNRRHELIDDINANAAEVERLAGTVDDMGNLEQATIITEYAVQVALAVTAVDPNQLPQTFATLAEASIKEGLSRGLQESDFLPSPWEEGAGIMIHAPLFGEISGPSSIVGASSEALQVFAEATRDAALWEQGAFNHQSISDLQELVRDQEAEELLWNLYIVNEIQANQDQPATDPLADQNTPDALQFSNMPWEQLPNLAGDLQELAGDGGSVVIAGDDSLQAMALEQMLRYEDLAPVVLPQANESSLATLGEAFDAEVIVGVSSDFQDLQPATLPSVAFNHDLLIDQADLSPSLPGSNMTPNELVEEYPALSVLPGVTSDSQAMPDLEPFLSIYNAPPDSGFGTPYTPGGDEGGVSQNYDWTFVDTGNWPVCTFFTHAYSRFFDEQKPRAAAEPTQATSDPQGSTKK